MLPRYRQARAIAQMLRQSYRLVPPVQLERLFEPFRVIYKEESFPNDFSGLVMPLPNYPDWFLLAVNKEHPLGRRRFTIAHELGHIVMHHIPIRVELRSDIKEKEANAFAADLLMPADEVRHCMLQGMTVSDMASYFGVSVSAMSVRLDMLGLSKPDKLGGVM